MFACSRAICTFLTPGLLNLDVPLCLWEESTTNRIIHTAVHAKSFLDAMS